MKNRIAIWTPGGIGGGDFNQGLPILMNLVRGLSNDFQLTVFSFASVKNAGISEVEVVSPPQWLRGSILRWLFLIVIFSFKHLANRFKIIYSFWGYPTGTIAVVIGKLFKKPSMVSLLGGELASVHSVNYGHLLKNSSRRLVTWTCKAATKLTVISNYQLEILKKLSISRPVELIPFGTDTSVFIKQEKMFNGGVLKILHVASITEVKDQETLLKAFSILCITQPAVLRFVGADQMNGKMHALAESLKLSEHVEFIGAVPHHHLTHHYNWADMFILTSLSEGQNNSLTDAAQVGLLIASTPVGAAYDIGPDGVVTLPFSNPEAIAASVLQVVNKPELWKSMTTVSSQWAATYNLSWSLEKLSSSFNKLIRSIE